MIITATKSIRIDVPGAKTLNEAVATVYSPDSPLPLAMQESGWEFAEAREAAVGDADEYQADRSTA